MRAGLHTGECEVMGDDIAGIAVHIAARVSALAGPSEVLVSRTVKDLVAVWAHVLRPGNPRAQGRPRPLGALRSRLAPRSTLPEPQG